jgi:hypothetical protein
MPLAGLMKREMWKKLGGIDKNFIAVFWEVDLAMRMYEIGGRVVLSKNVWAEELQPERGFSRRIPRIFKKILRLFPKLRTRIVTLFITHEMKKDKARLFVRFGLTTDRLLLDKFWVMDNEKAKNIPVDYFHCIKEGRGAISKKRLEPFMSFGDKHILTVSQGSKGKWR